jgi:hypothetical protein
MYYFFIGPVLLPITPSALTVDIAGNNQVVTLINDGEINILHDPQLKEAAFDVLLPTRTGKYPFAFYTLAGAEALAFTEYFKLLQRRKIPFPFIVAKMKQGSMIPVGYEYMQAVIESYSQKEDATNGLDVVVSLKLKEYREYATIKVDASPTTDKDGKLVYKATKQRGKSFTSEIEKLIKEVGLEIGGAFGL